MNRCINDVAQVDFQIPWVLGFFLTTFIYTVVIMIVTSIFTPVVTLIVILCFVLVIIQFKKFVLVGTQIKRLTQISAAPVISLSSEFI